MLFRLARHIHDQVEEQTNNVNRCMAMLRFAHVLLMVGTLSLGNGVSSGVAQTSDFDASSTFLSGLVTGIRGNTLEIDNKSYELMPGVVIKNEQGNLMEPHDIVENVEVKFHLKQERIDKIVLILPR
jgi:hypothetical protein